MKKIIIALAFSALFGSPAFASTWNLIGINDNNAIYFDADTVVKNREITTLWLKFVQKTRADTDGSWATALRWQLDCSKRTIQTLAWSSYAAEGNYINSGNKASKESSIVPDSMGETVFKIACKTNFPRDTSGTDYFKIPNNDVFQFTKDLVENMNNKKDTAPK